MGATRLCHPERANEVSESKDLLRLDEELHLLASLRTSGDPSTAASLRDASAQDDRDKNALAPNEHINLKFPLLS